MALADLHIPTPVTVPARRGLALALEGVCVITLGARFRSVLACT